MSIAIPIWGEMIPLNENRSKYEDMKITKTPGPLVMMNWIRWVFGTKLMADNSGHDDFVDREIIKKGKAKDTYTDVPAITPYIVPGSTKSVVIAPGGAFCMVSTDNEGTYPAKLLNSAGISAFVLDYRLEPYRWPVPAIDVQRAVRYVRAHSAEWGISPDCVGVMGASAGGYAVASSAEFLGNDPVNVEGYVPDETDAQNGMPDFMILMYPVTNFDENPNMLANLKGPEFYTNPVQRVLWTKEYSLNGNYERVKQTPTFLCYGGKDMLKGIGGYAKNMEVNPSNQTMFLPGASHGFCGNEKWTQWEQPLLAWIGNLNL